MIGVLVDHPSPDGTGGPTVEAARRAVSAGRLDRPVEWVVEVAAGLPQGSAAAVEGAFGRLVERGVSVVLGPSVTDNGLVVRDLADRARIPCINWTGSEETRSEWMFHYQVGSLEEEPWLLARYLAEEGHRRLVVVEDRSPIGSRYGRFLDRAADGHGLEVAARLEVSPLADDLRDAVEAAAGRRPDALVYLGLGLSARALGTALAASGWRPPVVANSALMFGYAHPEWRGDWEGWTYVDAWSEDNPLLARLRAEAEGSALPMSLAAGHDLGRLAVEALAGGSAKEALEQVKCLPAALGTAGTTMGFGRWDRAALKGGYLVLRRWQGGESVRVP